MRKIIQFITKYFFEIIFAKSFLVACAALGTAAIFTTKNEDPQLQLLYIFAPAVIISSISGTILLIRGFRKRTQGNIT